MTADALARAEAAYLAPPEPADVGPCRCGHDADVHQECPCTHGCDNVPRSRARCGCDDYQEMDLAEEARWAAADDAYSAMKEGL